MARKTLLQRRLVDALPGSNFKVKPAMIKAGYSPDFARGNQKVVMNSKGVKELMADKGFSLSEDKLIGEYEFIATQRKDLTNKRAVVENILAYKNPKLDFRNKSNTNTGTTYNTQVNIIDSKARQERISELTKVLLSRKEDNV